HARRADVAGLPGAYDVVERAKRLLNGRLNVPPMNLVEIDVIHPETAQRGVDRRHQMLARESAIVRIVAHRVVRFGRDDQLVARSEILQRPSEHFLAPAERVHVGGVEKRDAAFDCTLDEWTRGFLRKNPRTPRRIAVRHRAKADARHLQAARAEPHVIHRRMLSRDGLAFRGPRGRYDACLPPVSFSYGTIRSHSSALDRATTATTGLLSLRLKTSCGTPGAMKMKSPAAWSTRSFKPSPYSWRTR